MSTIAEVIAAHVNVYDDRKEDTNIAVCECGHESPFTGPYDPDDGSRAHAAHVAEELTKAGYGDQHQAWEAGHTHCFHVENPHNKERNPYPKGRS
jgi:hypothetical protein